MFLVMIHAFLFPESKILGYHNLEEHFHHFFSYLAFVGMIVFLIFTIGITIYFSMPVSNPLNDPFIKLLLRHDKLRQRDIETLDSMHVKSSPVSFLSTSSLPDHHSIDSHHSITTTEVSKDIMFTPIERSSIKSLQKKQSYEALEFSPTTMPLAIQEPSMETSIRYNASSNSTLASSNDLHASNSVFLSSSNIDLTRPHRRICIITAHPDDEVMFFSPTILQLCEWSSMSLPTPPYSHILSGRAMPILDIYLLCFTNGNAKGLGKQRSKELFASATTLGLSIDHIALVQEKSMFSDGPEVIWNTEEVVRMIDTFVVKWNLDVIMTFDQYGVSKHPNHIALHHAVESYVKQMFYHRHVLGFSLQTTNIVMKYTGLLSLLLYPTASLIVTLYHHFKRYYSHGNNDTLINPSHPMLTFVANPFDYIVKIWPAMRKHRSQLVWFRYLYMFSSMYLFQNSFIMIEPIQYTENTRSQARYIDLQ